MEVIYVPIKELKVNSKNRNKHSKDQIERMIKLIDYQGFRDPIIVSNQSGLIVAGHGRYQAAKKMKLKEVPVSFQDFKDDDQELAFQISHNAIAEWSELDFSGINEDVGTFDPSFDLELLGIHNFTIDVADKEELTDPDEIPDKVEPKAKLGDIYQLGEHRLMCGDSTDITTVESLMGGKKADLLFTDPPYGVSYEGGHNKKKRKGIENDTLAGESLTDLFRDSLANAYLVTHEHSAFYIWYANGKAVETFSSFSGLSLKVRAVICWYKIKSGLGAFMSQYIPNYEPCIYAHKDGCSPQWFGPTDEKTVWELKKEPKNEFHPTQKPAELPERAINNSSKPGDIVLDLFGGSGSTLIAAEKTGRVCYMMELDPHYVDIIIARYEAYSGNKAVLTNG